MMDVHCGRCFLPRQVLFSMQEHPSGMIRKLLCLVAGASALMNLQPLDGLAQTEGPAPASYERISNTVDSAEGVSWRVVMAQQFTTNDSIWAESTICNKSAETKTLVLKDGALPRAVLSGTDIPVPKQCLLTPASVDEIQYRKCARLLETFHTFRMDLRATFGHLPAGEYQLSFVWPKDEYAFRGLRKHESVDLKSAAFKFRILETTLDEATQKIPHNGPGATVLVPEHKNIEEFPEGPLVLSFTNRLTRPVHCRVTKPLETSRDTLSTSEASLFVRKWFPGTWYLVSMEPPRLKEGAAAGFMAVQPGESIELIAPHRWLAKGDGIYVYELRLLVQIDDHVSPDMIYLGSPKVYCTSARSEPFLVKLLHDE